LKNMASRIPGALSNLRGHLHDAIKDPNDLQLADGYVLDLINAFSDGPDADVGEAEGRKVDAKGRVAGEDRMPMGMGLDRAIVGGRARGTTPLGMKRLFQEFPAPRQANGVR
jgi:hypothetical protein